MPGQVSFDDCVLEPESRRLLRRGKAIPLQPKVMDLLLCLVQERHRYVSKDELHKRLWPHVFVGSTSLPRLVKELRRALADRRQGARVIRTLHGRGYQFIAPLFGYPPELRTAAGQGNAP